MKIYHWNRSEFLQEYGLGDILVLALTAEEARQKVRDKFMDYMRERYEWHFLEDGTLTDPDDASFIEEYRSQMEKDISADPEVTEGPIFIRGSQ